MQHVHDQGIVHRDLKPGNILLDRSGEPAVCDFGLAKITQAAGEHTPSGNVMGTVAYLSPEQATGSSRQVQPSSDLWALGVILYELLTGQRPFVGDSVAELLRHIQYDAPPLPRTLEPALDRDLENIVLRCLAKDPSDRYASAGALADDLARWLHGEPVTVPLDSWSRKLRRQWKRRPLIWAAVVAATVALAAVPVLLYLLGPPVEQTPLDKQTPLEKIQSRLQAGEAVELIPARGAPLWSEWVTGLGEASLHRAKDGALAVQSLDGLALFELLPRVELEKYRLEAFLRHDDGSTDTCFGLYTGRSELPPGTGRHFFIVMTFAEQGSRKGRAELSLRALADPALGKPPAIHSLGVSQAFEETTPDKPDYRRLVVEVRPQSLRLFWGDEFLREVSRGDIDLRVGVLMKSSAKPAGRPAFSPHEGLGLFVYRGTTSVKSVTIQALQQ